MSISSSPSSISFKVRYGSDLRRFRLPTDTLTYPVLLQTLMNAFGLDSRVRVTYKDEEGDDVLIGSTRELQAALIPPPTLLHLTLTTIDKMDESMILVEHTHITSPTPSTLEATQETLSQMTLEEKQTPIPTATSPTAIATPQHSHVVDENHGPIDEKQNVSPLMDEVEEKIRQPEPIVVVVTPIAVDDISAPRPPPSSQTDTPTQIPTLPQTVETDDLVQSVTLDTQVDLKEPEPPTPMPLPVTLDIPAATSSSPISFSSPTVSLPIPVAEPTSSSPVTTPTLATTSSSSGSWFVDKLKGLFSSEPTVVPTSTPAPPAQTPASAPAPTPAPAPITIVPSPIVVPPEPVVSASSSSLCSVMPHIPMSPEDPEEAAIAAALERSQYLNAEEKQQHLEPKEEIMSIREFIEQDRQPQGQGQEQGQGALLGEDDKAQAPILSPSSPSASSSPIVAQLLSTLTSAVTGDLTSLITASQLDLHTVFTPLVINPSDFASTRDALLADVSRIITRHHKHHVEMLAAEREAKLAAEAEEAGRAAAAAAEAFAQEVAERTRQQAQLQAQQQRQQQQQQPVQVPPLIDVLPETPEQAARRVEEEIRVRLLALEQMGFSNTALNRRLLQTNHNNLGDVIEWLITNNAVDLGPISPSNHLGPM